MPTYDYQCTVCGHEFEAFQSMTEKPLKKCPQCGKAVKRLIGGGAGILFKGSGFYQTDYRSKKHQDSLSKEKGQTKSEKSPPKKDEGGQKKKD